MKKYTRFIIVLGLLSGVVFADEIQQKVVVQDSKSKSSHEIKIEEIDNMISETLDFIDNQPIRLEKARLMFSTLKERSEKNQEYIKDYLTVINDCTQNVLVKVQKKNCETLLKTKINKKNYGKYLKDQKELIKNAINYIDQEIEKIQQEGKIIPKLRAQIEVFKNMKKALLGEV